MKRKGTTKARVMPSVFQLLQTPFLSGRRTVVTIDNIPASLILSHLIKSPFTAIDEKW